MMILWTLFPMRTMYRPAAGRVVFRDPLPEEVKVMPEMSVTLIVSSVGVVTVRLRPSVKIVAFSEIVDVIPDEPVLTDIIDEGFEANSEL